MAAATIMVFETIDVLSKDKAIHDIARKCEAVPLGVFLICQSLTFLRSAFALSKSYICYL